MNDSILTSIKKLLGINEEYEHFDQDIIIHINSVFMTLKQIGIGPSEGFMIRDKSSTWNDFLNTGASVIRFDGRQNVKMDLGALQSYVYIKVKLIFDPPPNSFTIESLNKVANEYEWRLNLESDK